MNEEKSTINICYEQSPLTLDPRKNGEPFSSTTCFMLYNGLCHCLSSGEIVPSIAKSWDISEDRKTYTFHLRDAKWSDGTSVKARDFEFSWKSALDPAFPCINQQMFYPIKNAEKISLGKISSENLGVYAPDDFTLILELEKPTPQFLHLICFCNFYPVPSHIAEKDDKWDTNYDHFVTNGSFCLKEYFPFEKIVLIKNPYYWNVDNVKNEGINIQIINSSDTALRLFEENKLDFVGSFLLKLSDETYEKYQTSPAYKDFPQAIVKFVTFNTKEFPFHNKNMRKAFSLAINREDLSSIYKIPNKPAHRFLPYNLIPNDRRLMEDCNPELAQIFFEKGLKDLGVDAKKLNIKLIYWGNAYKTIALFVKEQWEKTFGIKVSLECFDMKSLLEKYNTKDYQAGLYFAFPQIGDAIDVLERYKLEENPKNYMKWENSEYIDLVDKSFFARNSDERLKIFEEAEKCLLEDAPLCPLLCVYPGYLTHVEGIYETSSNGLRFELAKPQSK